MPGHLIKVFYPEAPSGSVQVLQRGSGNTAAAVYDVDDVRETTHTLDGSGRWHGYVFEPVDVVVLDADGGEVDSWSESVRAELVALGSASFTGTLATGSQGAGGITSLAEALDSLNASFDGTDFLVTQTGHTVAQTLVAALAGLASANTPFFDVRNYGAKGDGTTDDLVAITAATAAAEVNGGIVYFPPCNDAYRCSSPMATASPYVSFLGCGSSGPIRFESAASVGLTIVGGSSVQTGNFIHGIEFQHATTSSEYAILVSGVPGLEISKVVINGGATGFKRGIHLQSRTVVRNCFIKPATTPRDCIRLSSLASGSVIQGGNWLEHYASTVDPIINVGVNDITIENNQILHYGAAGEYGVDVEADGIRVARNRFSRSATGAGAGAYAINIGANFEFVEEGNLIDLGAGVFAAPYKVVAGSAGYSTGKIRLLSRAQRADVRTAAAAAATFTFSTNYGLCACQCTVNGTVATTNGANNLGDRFRLMIATGGVALTVAVGGGAAPQAAGVLFNNFRYLEWVYVGTTLANSWLLVIDVNG